MTAIDDARIDGAVRAMAAALPALENINMEPRPAVRQWMAERRRCSTSGWLPLAASARPCRRGRRSWTGAAATSRAGSTPSL
jgi:hypothetical protein